MSGIKVINSRVAELRKLGFKSLQEWLDESEDHIYVGRDMTRYVEGAKKSKWHNPFKSKDFNDDVEKTVDIYKDYIRNSPLYNQLAELKGKTLACWCYPAPCHATALKELYEENYLSSSIKLNEKGMESEKSTEN